MGLDIRLPPRRRLLVWGLVLMGLGAAVPRLQRENLLSEGGELAEPRELPELPDAPMDWIGTDPLSKSTMAGKVWILKVWTFGCVNCVRSIPFTNSLLERYGSQVGVLGIHSPEFDWERDRAALTSKLQEHGVRFPSFVDSSLEYFFALEATGWPAYYVVDREGIIRGRWLGEVHGNTFRASKLDALVRRLL